MKLQIPLELIDEIICLTDVETALKLNNFYAFRRLYDSRKHTLEWAVVNNKLEMVKFLTKYRNKTINNGLIVDAIWFDNFNIAEYLIMESQIEFDEEIKRECISYRCNLETIYFLKKFSIKFNQSCFDIICGSSDVETVRYFINCGYKINQYGIKNCVYYGKIEIFDVIYKNVIYNNNSIILDFNLLDTACDNGQFQMMKHLYYKWNITGGDYIIEKAILTKSDDIINWIKRTHKSKMRPLVRFLLEEN